MVKVAFAKTRMYAPDTFVLNHCGELQKKNSEYCSIVIGGVEYPIESVVIERKASGYCVYIKQHIYDKLNKKRSIRE